LAKYRLHHPKFSRLKLSKIHTLTFCTGIGYGPWEIWFQLCITWVMKSLVNQFKRISSKLN